MAQIDPLSGPQAVAPYAADDELETPPLPREHPKWVRDAASVSKRARRLIDGVRPLLIRVLTFWDHHIRSIKIGNRDLTIDASGSYRLE
ncbi:MAG TPA: hypothetical protein VFE17_03605 [Candidatus Baltobacteraceae bacterium]|jgi:hypothetical protein|nr:hypothetical protein [Candidatus Baltobacteraceae bacterium]